MRQTPHESGALRLLSSDSPATVNLEEMGQMPKVSRESAVNVADMGAAEDRGDELDGYAVTFVTIRQDADLAPMLKGLPDDRCQCPHWGLCLLRHADLALRRR